MNKHTIDEIMAICANCYHEFEVGETAYIDKEGDYLCEDCGINE